MSARLLEGRPVADAIWRDVDGRAASFARRRGRPPSLALISGVDESAAAYGRQIQRQFTRHGLQVLVSSADARDFVGQVRGFSADPLVDGVVLVAPLPAGVEPQTAVLAIDPAKDVDGQHPFNLGRLAQRRPALVAATALGGLRLLQHYDVKLSGTRAVVVGRSPVVGMPLALLLIDADAIVTVCHSRTRDLAAFTRSAEVLCVAAGRAGLIGPQHVSPGAVVVDFGMNPTPEGALVGDVQTDAVMEIAAAITPVRGGTGPTTVAILAEQTVRAAEARAHAD